MTERERIEDLHNKYLSLRENTPEMHRDGAECKAYHEWYVNAYVYFKSFDFLQNDPDFQIFVNAEKDGNCFVLSHVYDSICPSYNVLMVKTGKMKVANTNHLVEKPYKLFISHSSKDKEFVESLIDLLESLGFDSSTLFCSSVTGYGVGLGKDIFETLRELFNEYNLYVIFVHSPRYYKSAVSLNEMGAAWVLRTDFCSFLTSDMEFNKMAGVVNGNTISIKVDTEEASSRLTELKNNLIQVFGLPSIDETKWDRKRKAFLDQVLSIAYKDTVADEKNDSLVDFTSDELMIFSRWANNPIDSIFNALWTRHGLEVHFGYHNGKTYPRGETLAQYQDFMNRLQQAGFIITDGIRNNVTYYSITKRGYDFAKTLLDTI